MGRTHQLLLTGMLLLICLTAHGQGNVIVGEGVATNKLTLRMNSSLTYAGMDILQDGAGDAGIFFRGLNTNYHGIGFDQDMDLLRLGYGGFVPNLDDIVITNAGSIGFGTVNPQARFHISAPTLYDTTGIQLTQGAYNSLFYHNAGGELIIRKKNQTDQLVLGMDGKVGINTAAPTAELDVNGKIRMRLNGNSGYIPVSNPDGVMTWTNPATLGFTTFLRTGTTIHTNGNHATDDFVFGSPDLIGSGGNAARMQFMKGYAAFRVGQETNAQWDPPNVGLFSFATGYNPVAAGSGASAFGVETIANGFASMVIGTFNESLVAPQGAIDPETPLFIIGNGDNNASRSNALVVHKNGTLGLNNYNANTGIYLQSPAGPEFAFRVWGNGNNEFVIGNAGGFGFNDFDDNYGMYIRNNTETVTHTLVVEDFPGAKQFLILENGNSGFRHAYSDVQLNIRDIPTAANTAILRVEDGAGSMKFAVNSDNRSGFGALFTKAFVHIRNTTSFNTRILNVHNSSDVFRFGIWDDGIAGINNALADVTFTVQGAPGKNVLIRADNQDGNLRFMVDKLGNILAPNLPFGDHANMQYRTSDGLFFYDNSSRRYKRNIQPLDTDFRRILLAQPKTYTRPADPDRWEVGYIAEEMDSLGLKELVSYDKDGIPDGFNYEKMILYVTEILKQHDADINVLQAALEERDTLIRKQAELIDRLLEATPAVTGLQGEQQAR